MSKVKNIIKFYILANKLKEKIRTGWIDVKINKDRLESVAEHIYGTLILAIVIDSEYDIKLNMGKILKMLTIHELEEILMPDYTIRAKITPEERKIQGKKAVKQIIKGLLKETEIEDLLNEFNERKTKEAIFCYHIDKIECDFQAKIYDLQGAFNIDQARNDSKYYGNNSENIQKIAKNASDYWIEYDREKYVDDQIFENLLDEIKKLK